MAKAIASRIETLDEAFLVTLQGFVQAADAEGDAAVAGAIPNPDPDPNLEPAESDLRVCNSATMWLTGAVSDTLPLPARTIRRC